MRDCTGIKPPTSVPRPSLAWLLHLGAWGGRTWQEAWVKDASTHVLVTCPWGGAKPAVGRAPKSSGPKASKPWALMSLGLELCPELLGPEHVWVTKHP